MHKEKRDLANKDQSAAKKQEVILVEMKFRSNAEGVIEGHGNVDALSKTRYAARRIRSRQTGQQKGGRNYKKRDDVPEEMMLARDSTLKECSEIFSGHEKHKE